MFQNTFARFEGQIQTVKLGVTLFQKIDHAQALQVVLEASKLLHARIQGILPRMTKGGVPQVMRQGHSLDQIFIQTQRARNGAAQLSHFQRVRQPRSEQIAFVI